MLCWINAFSSAGSRAKPARFGEDPTKLPARFVAGALGAVFVAGVVLIVRGLM